jgi:hypothetical protein
MDGPITLAVVSNLLGSCIAGGLLVGALVAIFNSWGTG